jgi:hypothetical protein
LLLLLAIGPPRSALARRIVPPALAELRLRMSGESVEASPALRAALFAPMGDAPAVSPAPIVEVE